MTTTFVDAEGAFAAWVNSQAGLVGVGNPLPKGALLNRMRGAAPVCYVLLSIVGGGTAFGAEVPCQRARLSGQVYGNTKEAAAAAAVAYADTLITGLAGRRITVGGAELLVGDNLTGPLWTPDFDEPRYLVDIDVYFRPV